MSKGSEAEFSKKSSSSRSMRSGKSLMEKMRELGITPKSERQKPKKGSLQYVDIKLETNRPSTIDILEPQINLEQIMYYQPSVSHSDSYTWKNIYTIEKFETKSLGPNITRISDIEVKSYKPTHKMIFKKKKTHSVVMTKVQEILNRGRKNVLDRDPSEETIIPYQEQIPNKTIMDLSDTILQKIFFYFSIRDRCLILSKVCKTWYFMLQEPMFWNELEFSGSKVPSTVIIRLIKKYPTMESLRLTSVPDVIDILQELCRCNSTIKELGVRRCNVNSQDFTRMILHVIACCMNLEVLDIKGMRFQSDRFYIEIGRLRKLRSINLSGNTYIKNQDLLTLSINCRSLEELKILDITPEYNHRNAISDDDFSFILSHLHVRLKSLKIDMQQLGIISFKAILNCLNLKFLVMKNCLRLNSPIFRELTNLRQLKKLKLTRAVNIKTDDFQEVFDSGKLTNIEYLDISGCWGVGEGGLEAITKRLYKLKVFSLKNCKSICGDHLAHLMNCPLLHTLNLAHTNVTQESLLTLPSILPCLQVLVIDSNIFSKGVLEEFGYTYPSLRLRVSFSEFQKDERSVS